MFQVFRVGAEGKRRGGAYAAKENNMRHSLMLHRIRHYIVAGLALDLVTVSLITYQGGFGDGAPLDLFIAGPVIAGIGLVMAIALGLSRMGFLVEWNGWVAYGLILGGNVAIITGLGWVVVTLRDRWRARH